jgi:hypothetical protein
MRMCQRTEMLDNERPWLFRCKTGNKTKIDIGRSAIDLSRHE